MFRTLPFIASFALATRTQISHTLGNPRCFNRAAWSTSATTYLPPGWTVEFGPDPLPPKPASSLYSLVDPRKHEVRILLLHPGSGNSVVRCDLYNISLDHACSYSALSYTWQEPIRRSASLWTLRGIYQYIRQWYWSKFQPELVTIQLNGTDRKVGRNLASALLHLRRQDEALHLWADAICIDQDDPDEKSNQVWMMSRIYELAQKTYVWLGPSADNSDTAMDFISSMSGVPIEDPALAIEKIAPWSALQALFARSWWSRIWIVQEVLLSREVIVKCGNEEVDLDHFISLARKESEIDTWGEQTDAWWTWVPKVPLFDIILMWNQLHERVTGSGVPLSFWMGLTASFNSTLPRDKIYALLQLSAWHDKRSIWADYSASERTVFRDATIHFLRSEENLKFLRKGQIEHKTLDLPSWVPDYSVDPNRPVPLQDHPVGGGHANWLRLTPKNLVERYTIDPGDAAIFLTLQLLCFFAFRTIIPKPGPGFLRVVRPLHSVYLSTFLVSCHRKFRNGVLPGDVRAQFSPDSEILLLHGLRFDDVSAAFPAPSEDVLLPSSIKDMSWLERKPIFQSGPMIETFGNWLGMAYSLSTKVYGDTHGVDKAFQETLAANSHVIVEQTNMIDLEWERDKEEKFTSWGSHSAWKRQMQTRKYALFDKLQKDMQIGKLSSNLRFTMSRAFIITKQGYMGLAPAQTLSGDVICVLRGGTVPYVLRPTKDGCFQLVGECYVQGIMDGSFANQAEAQDVRVFKLI